MTGTGEVLVMKHVRVSRSGEKSHLDMFHKNVI